MNIREFTPGVHYVGVNDRVKQIFEAMWPIPHGVSYNSYIVKGQTASALIDTVQIDEVCRFLKNIECVLDGKAPDYLVINHMEPDHSGAIPEVVRAYPSLKLVGNAQTISMVRGFYHIADDSRFLEVKDGADIDLGGKTLRFYLTPMVHWPETMMTYLPENKLLFAGDAFGCFGALNGGVTDEEMDTDCYFPEMYRYYTNIVGKYGKFVQKALAKLQGLEVETICSTHGPVWRKRVGEVIALYDRLSAYRCEPGVTIVYGSMYGNTAEVAEEIARQLTARGVRNIKIHNAAVSSMSDMITDAFRYEGLIVGSTTYSMRLFPPVEQFLNAMETREVQGKVFATFGGYTWAKGAVPAIMQSYAERMKLPIVAQMMMCRSVDDAMLAEARALADKVADELSLKN